MRRPLRACLLDSIVELHVPPEVERPLRRLLPRAHEGTVTAGVVVEGDPRRGYAVRGEGRASHAADASTAVERVLEVCNGTAVEQCRDFAVHAGVVHLDGRVVALPAASGVGKTTLVACLLRQGWSYVSDEALVLTQDGDVRPYPKWLSLHRWTLDRLDLAPPPSGREERPAAASELGAALHSPGRLRLTDVVVPTRTGRDPNVTPLDKAHGALELLRLSFNHYRDPQGSVALVGSVARQSRTWSVEVGDPVDAAALLTTVLTPRP